MPRNVCCVPGCQVVANDGVPLHYFPCPEKDAERFKKWIQIIGGDIASLDSTTIYKTRRICRRHFLKKFLYPKNRLCKLAVPYLLLPSADVSGEDCNVILHSFPNPIKEEGRFRTWLYSIGGDILVLDSQFVYKNRKICHKHFKSKYHTRSSRLSANAVPTLYLKAPSQIDLDCQPSTSQEAISLNPNLIQNPTRNVEYIPCSSGVPLHRFPNPETSGDKFTTWISNIGGETAILDHQDIYENRRVCHRHFEDIHKYPSGRLSKLAIPTMHVPQHADLQGQSLSAALVMTNADASGRSQIKNCVFDTTGMSEMSDLLVLDPTPTSPSTSPPTPPPTLFCICCLQIEVPLISLLTCSHAEFINSFMIPEIKPHDQVVCNECHEMLKKIKLFKLQVQESFKLLSDSSKEKSLKFSNLKQSQNLTIHQTLKLDIPQTSSKDNLKTIYNTEKIIPRSSQNQDKKTKNIEQALKIINANQNNGSLNTLASSLQSISHSLITDVYTRFQLNKSQSKQTELNVQAQIKTNNDTAIGKNKNTEYEIVINDKRSENIDVDVRNEEGYQSVIEKDDSMDVCGGVLTDAADAPFDPNVILLTLSKEELSQERAKIASLPAYVHAKYRCKSCLIGFQFKENLADHVKRKHTLKNKQSSLKCRVCRQFVRRDLYNVHTSRHYNRYQCISCGEQFCSYENATVHHTKQHTQSGRIKKTVAP